MAGGDGLAASSPVEKPAGTGAVRTEEGISPFTLFLNQFEDTLAGLLSPVVLPAAAAGQLDRNGGLRYNDRIVRHCCALSHPSS
jgi:hypothetical protein